jgi:hypothetical protein
VMEGLACRIAATVVLWAVAILVRVSPALTVYLIVHVLVPVGGRQHVVS